MHGAGLEVVVAHPVRQPLLQPPRATRVPEERHVRGLVQQEAGVVPVVAGVVDARVDLGHGAGSRIGGVVGDLRVEDDPEPRGGGPRALGDQVGDRRVVVRDGLLLLLQPRAEVRGPRVVQVDDRAAGGGRGGAAGPVEVPVLCRVTGVAGGHLRVQVGAAGEAEARVRDVAQQPAPAVAQRGVVQAPPLIVRGHVVPGADGVAVHVAVDRVVGARHLDRPGARALVPDRPDLLGGRLVPVPDHHIGPVVAAVPLEGAARLAGDAVLGAADRQRQVGRARARGPGPQDRP